MRFFLGSHVPKHLERTEVDLFISRRTLMKRKSLLNPICEWALDSGGFSELRLNGTWSINAEQYVEELKRYSQMDGLQWAAPQDWMTEPFMIEKTGLSVREHLKRTVDNYLEIQRLDPPVHVIPVLQGWELDDYRECFELYESQGVDLRNEPVVGVGSVCRRQASSEIERIMRYFYSKDLRLHGFGVKTGGLSRYRETLESADSLAWSFSARYGRKHCSIHKENPTTKNCANCLQYALEWRSRLIC